MFVLLRGLRDSMPHVPTAALDEAAPLRASGPGNAAPP